jgi:hypothetical protein
VSGKLAKAFVNDVSHVYFNSQQKPLLLFVHGAELINFQLKNKSEENGINILDDIFSHVDQLTAFLFNKWCVKSEQNQEQEKTLSKNSDDDLFSDHISSVIADIYSDSNNVEMDDDRLSNILVTESMIHKHATILSFIAKHTYAKWHD